MDCCSGGATDDDAGAFVGVRVEVDNGAAAEEEEEEKEEERTATTGNCMLFD